MRYNIFTLWATTLLLASCSPLSAQDPGEAASFEGQSEIATSFQPPTIQVPDGFVVELAAAPPLVRHPLMANFDDRGRLFIAESAGQNLRREELEKQLPNFVRMVEDTDGDGVFDKSTIFADKMTLPQGALWYDGALYVAAPPCIWRLEDTDGDGVADRREKLVDEFGYTGNAASIHGCFLGPGGRIYWCDGRHGHQFRNPDGTISSQGKAARIFSCRPDGSDIQVHCGGGMDNPVEVDFTEEGEMLGTVNLFYRKRGDCLVHWMHGGVYPRFDQQACIDEFPSTGDLLREVSDLGHVAVSGMTRYRGTQWGPSFRDNLFITKFNTHQVARAQIERRGATFTAVVEDFLTADSEDFHPTDVLEDADGSLLVIDTGGWFRIGCPTSQIAKPNILGAIYRIRREGATSPPDPRGLSIDWSALESPELFKLLDDDRPAVRERAIALCASRGEPLVPALDELLQQTSSGRAASVRTRRNTVWALTRIGSPAAQRIVRKRLSDSAGSVRLAAAHSAGITRDPEAAEPLAEMVVADEDPQRREAATSLGKIGKSAPVAALLKSSATAVDRVMEHAIIYALIQIADREATLDGLQDSNPKVRQAALIALDQMPGGNLTRDLVTPLLETDDYRLQSTVLEVVGRHPQWASEMEKLVTRMLQEPDQLTSRRSIVLGGLLAFRNSPIIRQRMGEALRSEESPDELKTLMLEAISRSHMEKLPVAWEQALHAVLHDGSNSVRRQAVATIANLDGGDFQDSLWRLADDRSLPADLRVSAIAAALQTKSVIDESTYRFLTAQLRDDDAPPMTRLAAARAFSDAELTRAQQEGLLPLVGEAGPLEIRPLIDAFQPPVATELVEKLLDVLQKAPGRENVDPSQIQTLIADSSQEVQQQGLALVARLEEDLREKQGRLSRLLRDVESGDASRGREIFMSKRTACVSCHRIRNDGGRVGPDLSTIGQRRSSRDLLEAIIYPSVSLARGYESYAITTSRGRIFSGLITREAADHLLIRSTDQTETRLPRDEIDEIAPISTSVMPAGLEKTMSREQLRDLIAYLRSLK